ncbi:MAG: RluA family pseudouridine synthase [Planctomycetes bacterium]|nr:RluA family pseudouridine synthase [Planctomycetota bacterium]
MDAANSLFIDRSQANRTLLEILQSAFRLPRARALRTLAEKKVRICGGVCVDPRRRVKLGQHIQVFSPAPTRRVAPKVKGRQDAAPCKSPDKDLAGQIVVRYLDEQIVIVVKPPGLTTVRHAGEIETLGKKARKFLPTTLVDLLPAVLSRLKKKSKGRIRAVHRLDKDTSGLLVLARTPEAESHLGKQFRAHTIGRRYLALVRGKARGARIETRLVADRGDGRRGSGPDGQLAITQVRVVETLGDFTLVECELETGRTHQVRIHLGEAGTPLCGERVYDRPLHGKPLPDTSGADRPMLHAAYLALDHPATGKRMDWHAAMPEDMRDVVNGLEAPR